MYGGDFMFWVINSKKFLLYILTFLILLTIICMSGYFTNAVVEVFSNNQRLVPIYSVETDKKQVAITFDCAWGSSDIPSILKTLDDNGCKATFFLVGTWIDKYPEMVKLIADGGHDIANHSNSHAHVNKLSYEKNREDIKACSDKIEKITGFSSKYYRGPYGEYNNTVVKAARDEKHEVIQWSIDTLDYTGKTPKEMCERINDKLQNGSIILMHNDTKYTSQGLQLVIDTIEEKGFEIVPVSELIYKENYEINSEGRQRSILPH
jgi:polysaccharide deacetylase family sporulation protein PdaB